MTSTKVQADGKGEYEWGPPGYQLVGETIVIDIRQVDSITHST